jgi:histidine triad (HIT) family protein
MDCIFCKVAGHEIPAEIIFEDNQTFAFLDIHPRAPGHTLIIPKKHAENVLDAEAEALQALALTLKKVTGILHSSLKPAGFTIGINQGKEAGQAVNHLHIHLMPRFKSDGGGNIHSIVNNPPTESIAQIAARIRQQKV